MFVRKLVFDTKVLGWGLSKLFVNIRSANSKALSICICEYLYMLDGILFSIDIFNLLFIKSSLKSSLFAYSNSFTNKFI